MTERILDITVDLEGLYKEESFTDLKQASIRQLIPVHKDGAVDDSRETVYVGTANVMSPAGPVPLQDIIKADSLEDAFNKLPDAMNDLLEQLITAQKERQSQEESRIIVPDMKVGGDIIQ